MRTEKEIKSRLSRVNKEIISRKGLSLPYIRYYEIKRVLEWVLNQE